jgi:quinol monooxygenase YgiN
MIALSVDVRCRLGRRADFLARLKLHAATCLAQEPGCRRFDIMVPRDEDDRVIIFEVYDDEAALAAHDASAHMAAFRADAAPMIESRLRITGALA